MTSIRALAVLAAAATLSATAFAQAPAAPAPAAPAANPANMPKCEKPDPHPGRLASQQKSAQWNKSVSAWQECMKKGIAELQAKADAAVKEANAAVADSNGAIASYNATVKELQEQVELAK